MLEDQREPQSGCMHERAGRGVVRWVNIEEREVNPRRRSPLSGCSTFVVLDVAAMNEFRLDAHPGKQNAHFGVGAFRGRNDICCCSGAHQSKSMIDMHHPIISLFL